MSTPSSDEIARLIENFEQAAQVRLEQGIKLVMSANQVLASEDAAKVMSALRSLTGKDIEKTEPESFMEFCKAVEAAFPGVPTDEEILSFAYTPALLRYFVASLKRCAGTEPNKLNLAVSFLATRPRKQPPLERVDGRELLALAQEPFERAIREGKTRPEAVRLAASAAHDEWYGVPADEIEARRKVARIERFLVEEWFGEPGKSLN